jgi:hypothetical protein
MTTEEFILKEREIHGYKYDLSKTKYINSTTKVCIICPEHGEFWQLPSAHLQGQGCPKCKGRGLTKDDVLDMFHKVHGNRYNYNNIVYKNLTTKIIINCPVHGNFEQKPTKHMEGQGCPICGNKRKNKERILSFNDFVDRANIVHHKKYSYISTALNNLHDKVEIICPIHGVFKQNAYDHLNGHGCNKCNESNLEKELMKYFEENCIIYEYEKKFDWMKPLSLDFYLPEYNTAIECQGIQHFKPVEHFGGEKYFNTILERDERKRKLCNLNNIRLLYFSHEKITYPYKIYTDVKELVENIIPHQ